TTLAEMVMFSGKGAEVSLDKLGENKYEVLYSEAQSGVVITCNPEQQDVLEAHFSKNDVPYVEIGLVNPSPKLEVTGLLELSLDEMSAIYDNVIESAMQKK
ncbi:MAG TPA: AIR synthase-related protein, partial [Balneolaceae bacterium]|nr:AIR synthase-related protein [Balneolaceae bacterium]